MAGVVADTGPLHYFLLIGHAEMLPALFNRIAAPVAVMDELRHSEAPLLVRQWAESPPGRLDIVPNSTSEVLTLPALGAGEAATIRHAAERGASLILMDDRAGVAAARARGLRVTGTLGVLDRLGQAGMIDLPDAVARLRRTSFRAHPQLLDAFLTEHTQRRLKE